MKLGRSLKQTNYLYSTENDMWKYTRGYTGIFGWWGLRNDIELFIKQRLRL